MCWDQSRSIYFSLSYITTLIFVSVFMSTSTSTFISSVSPISALSCRLISSNMYWNVFLAISQMSQTHYPLLRYILLLCLAWNCHHALDFPSYNLRHNLNSPSNPIGCFFFLIFYLLLLFFNPIGFTSEMALKLFATLLNLHPLKLC